VAGLVRSQIQHNQLPEMVVAFVPPQDFGSLRKCMDEMENQFRIRKGFRFRALLDYRGSTLSGSLTEVKEEEFRMLVLSDAKLDKDDVLLFTDKADDKAFERTSVFLDAPDQGSSYKGYGGLHIALKEKEISHEYRVREGYGGFDWFLQGLPEILKFTAESFHK